MNAKTILSLAFVFLLIAIGNRSFAQLYLGPKLAYNGYYNSGGGGLEIGQVINEKFKASVDVIYYIPREVSLSSFYASHSVKQSFMEANLNFSYLFTAGSAYIYPIGGVQVAFLHEEIHQSASSFGGSSYNQSSDFSDTGFGVNLGAGIRLNRKGRVSPTFDFKYAVSHYGNGTFSLTFPINFTKAE